MDKFNQYLKDQLAEQIKNYGPIGVLWFDGQWERFWTHERGIDMYEYVRKLQPDIIINDRVYNSRQAKKTVDKEARCTCR